MAVADGAGSASRAEVGSKCAVDASLQYLFEHLEAGQPETADDCRVLLENTLRQARVTLQEIAPGEKINEVATTLLLTLVTSRWLGTIQVGDGAVVCRDLLGNLRVLSQLGQSEYINETTFLTSSDYVKHVHHVTMPSDEISGLAMMSDGIEFLALRYADNSAHEPFFRSMFEFAENPASTDAELAEFLRSERVCERTDDDKTLVLSVRS